MAYMKMLSLAFLASAKGTSPAGEKHPASVILSTKLEWSATAKEAK
jgi:hypothetical protein